MLSTWSAVNRCLFLLRTSPALEKARSDVALDACAHNRRCAKFAISGYLTCRAVPLAKNPSTGTAQQRLFLVVKVVLHAVVVISEVLCLSTKSRCSRCCRHISTHMVPSPPLQHSHITKIFGSTDCFHWPLKPLTYQRCTLVLQRSTTV